MSTQRRSILEELNQYVPSKNREEILESRAEHVISSAINLIEYIQQTYSAEEAEQLEKRLLSSIKSKDSSKFSRTVKKIKEGSE